jgi:hypothetical protein
MHVHRNDPENISHLLPPSMSCNFKKRLHSSSAAMQQLLHHLQSLKTSVSTTPQLRSNPLLGFHALTHVSIGLQAPPHG